MLQAISWLQFSITVFLGLIAYYGYFLYRYYGAGWLKALSARLEKIAQKKEPIVEEPEEVKPATDPSEPAKTTII